MQMLPGLGIAWLCLSAVLVLTVYACSEERRPHFAARLVALLFTPPALVGILAAGYKSGVIGAATGLLLLDTVLFVLLPGVLIAPTFLFKTRPSSDGDGGGGSGPDDPEPEPQPPRGGVPLLDAEQAAVRMRDHNRPWRRWARPSRSPREPAQRPARRFR
jgi:hypothetical protein